MTSEPALSLLAMRTSTAAFVEGVESERWTDNEVRADSLLPGWTRAHVLTHVARNADGISRTLSGALRGEILARYPAGRVGRDADIEAGAARPSAQLLADVRESAQRLDRVLAAVADADGWQLATDDRPAGAWPSARRREIEVHRIDLRAGYTAADWPPDFVSYLLPELLVGLGDRVEGAVRVRVSTQDSVTGDLGGLDRRFGSGSVAVADVSGPDWAVLAWLIGRPAAAKGALSSTPELGPWI